MEKTSIVLWVTDGYLMEGKLIILKQVFHGRIKIRKFILIRFEIQKKDGIRGLQI